jgi:hypothetical protein
MDFLAVLSSAALGMTALAVIAKLLEWLFGSRARPSRGTRIAVPTGAAPAMLRCMAGMLPSGRRQRFAAEAVGDLGVCENWWQRLWWLVGLAFGLPRLAWMMHREKRRDRA